MRAVESQTIKVFSVELSEFELKCLANANNSVVRDLVSNIIAAWVQSKKEDS